MNNQWQIIKKHMKAIEHLNDVKFGDETWSIIKRMDSELTALHGDETMDVFHYTSGLNSILGCSMCGQSLQDCECN